MKEEKFRFKERKTFISWNVEHHLKGKMYKYILQYKVVMVNLTKFKTAKYNAIIV